MSRLVPCILGTLLATAPAGSTVRAAEVMVRWEPVERDVEGASETISHYLLHLGRSPRPPDVVHSSDGTFRYEQVINAGAQTEHRFEDLKPGTWFFAVTAVDTEGNLSDYSAEVRLGIPDEQGQIPPPVPVAPRPATGPPSENSGACASAGGPGGGGWLLVLLVLIALRRLGLGRQIHRPGA